jgi:lysophospholipase L1-like esterase
MAGRPVDLTAAEKVERTRIAGSRIMRALLLLLILAAIALYESISVGFWNVLTGVLLLMVVFLAAGISSEALTSSLGCSRSTRVGLRVAIVTTALLVVGLELFLRYGVKSYQSYTERHGQFNFVSHFEQPVSTAIRVHHPGKLYLVRPEFIQSREINSLGLPEREIPEEKSPDELRIIALGDSFTEGTGADYESTWPKVLERELASAMPGRPVTVVNAGIGGSDVCFEYVLLRERLLALDPDLVVVAINATDLSDIVRRGGMERFRQDGSVTYALQPPSWEWLYAVSFITRHFALSVFRLDWQLMGEEERAREERRAALTILDRLRDFRALSKEKGFDLVILFHPREAHELDTKSYPPRFASVVESMVNAGDFPVIDLLSYYTEHGLMTEAPSEYFWPIDLHHNPAGYEIMGKAVAARLLDSGLID